MLAKDTKVDPEALKLLGVLLNGVIESNLPDAPTADQKMCAAYAFAAMSLLGIHIDNIDEVAKKLLPGETDKTDYITVGGKRLLEELMARS